LKRVKKIHVICNAQNNCPGRIEGWEDGVEGDWYSSFIIYGNFGAKFRITYKVADDGQSFRMTVKHNIDEGFDISGGVNKNFESDLWIAK